MNLINFVFGTIWFVWNLCWLKIRLFIQYTTCYTSLQFVGDQLWFIHLKKKPWWCSPSIVSSAVLSWINPWLDMVSSAVLSWINLWLDMVPNTVLGWINPWPDMVPSTVLGWKNPWLDMVPSTHGAWIKKFMTGHGAKHGAWLRKSMLIMVSS